MNKKFFYAFTMAETLITLSLIGILAITMVSLNNLSGNDAKIATAKLTQMDSALQAWGKAISKSNETGLGASQTVQDQLSLVDSLTRFLNAHGTTSVSKVEVGGYDYGAGNKIILDNDVVLEVAYRNPTDTKDGLEFDAATSDLAIISATAKSGKTSFSNEYALSVKGVENLDSRYEGWEKYPITTIGEKHYYCPSLAKCPSSCENNSTCVETQFNTDYIYIKQDNVIACGSGQTGTITTQQQAGGLTVYKAVIDTCCPSPQTYNLVDGEKVCSCTELSHKFVNLKSGYAYDDSETSTTCQRACSAGTYADSGSCAVCQAGNYCPTDALPNQITCPAGKYCPNDQMTEPIVCPAGSYCPSTGLTEATDCPAGYYCPEGSIQPTPCPIGTYNSSTKQTSKDACTPCSIKDNMHQDKVGSTACVPCTNGVTTNGITCTLCAAGSYFDAEQKKCIPCKAGTYQDLKGSDACKPCGKGYFCPEDGMTQRYDCPCGTYQPIEKGITCTIVEAGKYPASLDGSVAKYASANATDAEPCPAGYKCEGGCHNMQPCDVGTYQALTGQSTCNDCIAGTFQDEQGQTSCKNCACATWSNVRAARCMTCNEFKNDNTNHFYSDASQTTKVECTALKDNEIFASSDKCAATTCGENAIPKDNLLECICGLTVEETPDGQYLDLNGCKYKECDASKHLVVNAKKDGCECDSANHFVSDDNGKCVCAAGYELKDNVCSPCKEGFYKASKGNDECDACSCAQWSNEAATECSSCNKFKNDETGYYYSNPKKGTECTLLTDAQKYKDDKKCDVKECDDNYVPDANHTECICGLTEEETPDNNYFDEDNCEYIECDTDKHFVVNEAKDGCECDSANHFVANGNACVCDKGYELKDNVCSPCAKGFYKSSKGNDECDACACGHFTDTETAATSCSLCEGNTDILGIKNYTKYSNPAEGVMCSVVDEGNHISDDYCSQEADASEAPTCPAGQYNVYTSNIDISSYINGKMVSYLGGWWSYDVNITKINIDELGKPISYQVSYVNDSKQTQYAEGTFDNNGEASDLTLIYKTTSGMLLKRKINISDITITHSCESCPCGTYTGNTNTAQSCTACPDGTYSEGGASSCTSPEDGYTTAPDKCSQIGCPAGQYSIYTYTVDSAVYPGTNSWDMTPTAPVNVVITNDASGKIVYTYSDNNRQGEGYFDEDGIATNLMVRVPGTRRLQLSDLQFASHSCQACPCGTYNADTTATSCTACADGTYSAEGASSCANAEAGYIPTADKCSTSICPCGTYKASSDATSCTECEDGTYAEAGASSCSAPDDTHIVSTDKCSLIEACPAGQYAQYQYPYNTWNLIYREKYEEHAVNNITFNVDENGKVSYTVQYPGYYSTITRQGTFNDAGITSDLVLRNEKRNLTISDIILSCQPCPCSTYTDSANLATSCMDCPAGTYSQAGSNSQSSCISTNGHAVSEDKCSITDFICPDYGKIYVVHFGHGHEPRNYITQDWGTNHGYTINDICRVGWGSYCYSYSYATRTLSMLIDYIVDEAQDNDTVARALATVKEKMSADDLNRDIGGTTGNVFIIAENGTVIGTFASDKFLDYGSGGFVTGKEISITDLTGNNFTSIKYNVTNAEQKDGGYDYIFGQWLGGNVSINGCIYDVASAIKQESPLILDLKHNGIKLTNIANGVTFDLEGTGHAVKTAWTTEQEEFDDAFLCLDRNGNGTIDSGLELFGNQHGEENGFLELAKFDDNGDGIVDENDAVYKDLLLWCDMNKNGKVDDGELKKMVDEKVTEVSTEYEIKFDKNGKVITDEYGNTTGFVGTFKHMVEETVDGVTTLVEKIGEMIDVFFQMIKSVFE